MQRLRVERVTPERVTAFMGYGVGAVIGATAQTGDMGLHEWAWAGVAVLGVVQLHLLTMR